jgi:hypothetical protein
MLAGTIQGCASNEIRQNSYKLLGSYAIMVETGADLAENPATLTAVVDAIKHAKDVASPAVKALHDNLRAYADLQDQIKGIKDAGGTPDVALLQQMEAALTALRQSYIDTAPLISEIIKAVEAF